MDATKILKGSQEMVVDEDCKSGHELQNSPKISNNPFNKSYQSYEIPFERTFKMKNKNKSGIPKI